MKPLVSIVLPIYNEKDNIIPVVEEIAQVMRKANLEFEIVAIDDGSRDGSQEILKSLAQTHSWMKTAFFRRNFGQTAAFSAGFNLASGDIVVTMDADGQNDPADIPGMIDMLNSQSLDLVCGWRKARQDAAMRTWLSKGANRLIRYLVGSPVKDLGCSLKVFRREITSQLRLYGEMHRFISVLAANLGARVGETVVNHRARTRGQSKYGFVRTFKVLLDLITVWFLDRFQTKPIYVFGGVSFAMFGFAGLVSAYVLFEKFYLGIWVHKNPLLFLAIVPALIGAQLMGTGILAELSIRTYFESQGKPAYSIKARYGFDARSNDTQKAA